MADVFNFYVYDDRTIQFELAEPIMLEDSNVTQFQFRIPKVLNELDMHTWAWWFVYENASAEKYSVPLILADDEDDPDNYSLAIYTVDAGMSGKAGSIRFALEVIDADATTSEILHEWHTRTYTTHVVSTLQGNEREFTPSEYDLISAKLEEIVELIEGGGGGSTSDDITNESTVSGETVTDALTSLSDKIANLEGGAPTPAATVSAMADTSKIYLYTGSETGYNAGHWYYYSNGSWVDGGAYGEAASMSAGVKAALLACFQKVAWIDENGQTYYNNLYNELYPPANLVSISAVYTQSGTVYDTASLEDLKPDLVVTANFPDGTSQTVTTYTLSGTLAEGTSTITVAYGGKATTFNVIVTEEPRNAFKFYNHYGVSSNGRTPLTVDGAYKYGCAINNVRTTALDFDIEFEPNSTYELTIISAPENFHYGLNFYKYEVYSAVADALTLNDGSSISSAAIAYDPGWQTANKLIFTTGSLNSNGHDVSVTITNENGDQIGTTKNTLYGFRITCSLSSNAFVDASEFMFGWNKTV